MSQQFTPVLTVSLVATGALTANRFVTFAGALAGADANALGVTRLSAAIGERVPIDVIGTATVEAGAAVTAFASVKSDATGRAIAWVTSGCRLGIALEAATAAGQFIEVLLFNNPGYTT